MSTKRLYNTYEFIGELGFMNEPVRSMRFDSGWTNTDLNLIINESKTNGQFVKLSGGMHVDNGKSNYAYGMSKSVMGNQASNLKIEWDKRLDKDVLNLVADFSKVVIDLTEDRESLQEFYETKREIYKIESKEEENEADLEKLDELYEKLKTLAPDRHEFVHPIDAIEFLMKGEAYYREVKGEKITEIDVEANSILKKFKGRRFKVKGNIEMSYSAKKKQFYTNYAIQSMELVTDDEVKNKLSAQLDLFFAKGAEDKADFKKDKVLTYDTYIISRDNASGKDAFFPMQTVINASKLDLENPSHAGRLQFMRDIFETKAKKVNHIPFDVRIVRGSNEVEFTYEMLTAKQKQMVDLGLATVEKFKPKDGVVGDRIDEIRLISPVLENKGKGNNFEDGAVETDYTPEDLVYVPTVFEKKEDVKPKEEEKNDIKEDALPDSMLGGKDVGQSIEDLLGL